MTITFIIKNDNSLYGHVQAATLSGGRSLRESFFLRKTGKRRFQIKSEGCIMPGRFLRGKGHLLQEELGLKYDAAICREIFSKWELSFSGETNFEDRSARDMTRIVKEWITACLMVASLLKEEAVIETLYADQGKDIEKKSSVIKPAPFGHLNKVK